MIHSFWAYQLGVKADANPGVNNIAYVTTKGPLTFNVRCAELCGVWHGYMFDTGRVFRKAAFATLDPQQRIQYAPATKQLGPYRGPTSRNRRGEADDRDRDAGSARARVAAPDRLQPADWDHPRRSSGG